MCAHTPNLDALARSENTLFFNRFYAAAAVCSPTRAAVLTGRTNERDCISNALTCDSENPAYNCSMGKGLTWGQFTIAKAAKKSKLGDYETIMLGKWHLGDLWAKTNVTGYQGNYSNPGNHGFDRWMLTEAEASSSMSNCGCFPAVHAQPGPKPPSGYPTISPNGDHCVVGGGFASDWAYPCTDYYSPHDPRNPGGPEAVPLGVKVQGDDSQFIVDHFEEFLRDVVDRQSRPFLAHLALHSIHEPHPAMPEYWKLYSKDPDYLGTLTQMDVQIGRILSLLKQHNVYQNTVIFFTADNGPHQGLERSDIHWSTNFLRQCKASNFEGGLRVPGMVHAPMFVTKNVNSTMPATSADILPTIMELLQVDSDTPTWPLDGISLLPFLRNATAAIGPRPKPIGISWGGQTALIDNAWKLMSTPAKGQCTFQEPYASMKTLEDFYLFNLDDDYHEIIDRKASEPERLATMKRDLDAFLASIQNSQQNETLCDK